MGCAVSPAGDAHHLTTRGAGGDDTADNLCPLCRSCHNLIHQKGVVWFILNKDLFRIWLEGAGREDILSKVGKYGKTNNQNNRQE